jgi:hypothetical protein
MVLNVNFDVDIFTSEFCFKICAMYLFQIFQVSSHHSKRKIGEATKTPIEFLDKFDELKAKKYVFFKKFLHFAADRS